MDLAFMGSIILMIPENRENIRGSVTGWEPNREQGLRKASSRDTRIMIM
jgi:hypothetical protein